MDSTIDDSKKLKAYCTITSSKRVYASDYIDEGVTFIRGKEVVQRFSHSGRLESELFISRDKFELLRDRFGAPVEGDLLITSVGTLGVPYLVTADDEFYFKDGNLIWFREFTGLNSKYLYYWLQSPSGRAQLSKCTIGTSQPAYTIERLKEIELDGHSKDQQNRIASILSAYDDLIENNRRRIQLLGQAARLLYKEWFVRLRFPGHEHVKVKDGVPEGWERKRLSELCTDIRESIDPKTLPPETAYIGLEHIPRRSITLSDWGTAAEIDSSKFKFIEGDILFGKIRPYFHKVGFTLVGGITSSDAIVIRSTDSLVYHYVLLLLSSDEFVSLASKTVREGSKMPRADWKFLLKSEFNRPAKAVLELFNDSMKPICTQLKNLALHNQQLIRARDLLLLRLMSGGIAV